MVISLDCIFTLELEDDTNLAGLSKPTTVYELILQMSWLNEVGAEIFCHVFRHPKPTVLIVLFSKNKTNLFMKTNIKCYGRMFVLLFYESLSCFFFFVLFQKVTVSKFVLLFCLSYFQSGVK